MQRQRRHGDCRSYYCTNANFFGDETLQDMLAMGQIGAALNDIPVSEISGGKVVLSGLTLGVEYTFYALVKDAEVMRDGL